MQREWISREQIAKKSKERKEERLGNEYCLLIMTLEVFGLSLLQRVEQDPVSARR